MVIQQLVNNKEFATENQTQNHPAKPSNGTNKPDKYLFIKVDYSTVKVSFDEIRFVEGLKDYIKIYVNEKFLITKSTIKNLESKLPPELFTRVHKSYIISIDKIDKIEYNHIFIGQNKIPIGTQFKNSFYEKIDSFRL